MNFQIERISLYLRILFLFWVKVECSLFCKDSTPISNVYSFGRSVYITQKSKTIWKFDTKDLQISYKPETVASIFGTGIHFSHSQSKAFRIFFTKTFYCFDTFLHRIVRKSGHSILVQFWSVQGHKM